MTAGGAAISTSEGALAVFHKSHVPLLDGLRAVAILSVLLYHFGFESVPADLGVSLFFVLSGFLVTRGLLSGFERSGAIDVAAFHRRRALRIFPAYYAFLGLLFIEEFLRGYTWDPWLLAAGLTHTVNYYNAVNGHPPTGIAHLWAVSVLEQAYVVWPYVLRWVLPSGERAVVKVLLWVVCGILGWRVLAATVFQMPHAYLYNALETRLDSLAIGALIAMAIMLRSGMSDLAVPLLRVPPVVTMCLLFVSRFGGSESYHYMFGFTVESLLLAALALQLVSRYAHVTVSWLDSRPAVFLGQISYSVYLWHLLCFGIVNRLGLSESLMRLGMSLVLCVGVGCISYVLLERAGLSPIRKTAQ
ncbi:MAG: acyltransferase [Nitrospiraceae bacterium]